MKSLNLQHLLDENILPSSVKPAEKTSTRKTSPLLQLKQSNPSSPTKNTKTKFRTHDIKIENKEFIRSINFTSKLSSFLLPHTDENGNNVNRKKAVVYRSKITIPNPHLNHTEDYSLSKIKNLNRMSENVTKRLLKGKDDLRTIKGLNTIENQNETLETNTYPTSKSHLHDHDKQFVDLKELNIMQPEDDRVRTIKSLQRDENLDKTYKSTKLNDPELNMQLNDNDKRSHFHALKEQVRSTKHYHNNTINLQNSQDFDIAFANLQKKSNYNNQRTNIKTSETYQNKFKQSDEFQVPLNDIKKRQQSVQPQDLLTNNFINQHTSKINSKELKDLPMKICHLNNYKARKKVYQTKPDEDRVNRYFNSSIESNKVVVKVI